MNPSTKQEIEEETVGGDVIGRSPSARNKIDEETASDDQGSKEYNSLRFLFGSREDYLKLVVPLHEASIVGDWETAEFILGKRPELIRFAIHENLGTALHVAATAKESKQTLNFVENLVKMMTTKELELKNQFSNTALSVASLFGNLKMVMIMEEKNPSLLCIRGNGDAFPLTASALSGSSNMVKYLYNNSQKMNGDHWTLNDRRSTLFICVHREFFDLALEILEDHQELADNAEILKLLAQKPDAFRRVEKKLITGVKEPFCRIFHMKIKPTAEEDTAALKLLKVVWGHFSRTKNFYEMENILREPTGTLFQTLGLVEDKSGTLIQAAKLGNTRFIIELLRTYPNLVFHRNEVGHTIFHIAVMHRHQGVYNLMYEIGSIRNDLCLFIDNRGNNMLHLVGESSNEMTTKTKGASLLMQRELLWFKEVESMLRPFMREGINNDGVTAYELFSNKNEGLVSQGLKWIKDCMVVATLIVTVAFAVAYTVPGGNNQESGIPIFIHGTSFIVFVIADAMSLFSSTTSLLVFLSILASRHDQLDFMYSLPRKVMIGLVTLFISVAAMMVTFGASFFVLYHNGLQWVPILITAFAVVPVIMFAVLQFPLLVDMFRSMYDSHYLFKPKKRILYTTNPELRYSNYSPC